MSPARLGVGDGFGEGAATTWVSTDKEAAKKAEEEKVKAREVAVKAQNKKDAAKRSYMTKMGTAYKGFKKSYPKVASSLQGASFAGVGYVIAQLIKQKTIVLYMLGAFLLWGASSRAPPRALFLSRAEAALLGVGTGALLSLILSPYFAFLAKKKLSKNKTIDAVGKTVLDQLTMTPLLTATFLSYMAFVNARSRRRAAPRPADASPT